VHERAENVSRTAMIGAEADVRVEEPRCGVAGLLMAWPWS
jgi:hypothetical protein